MNPRAKISRLKKLTAVQKRWISEIIRNETLGGALLLLAALAALLIANSPMQSWFFALKSFEIGPEAIHLNLSLGTWASDGLLALFFLAAGIELKHELVHGSLRDKRQAAVPIAAAIGGMVVPALIYFSLNSGQETSIGWGIPMATDIAFALAILAVVGRKLPIELRAFLLTLAVVDDLGAIVVIALFYSSKFALMPLLAAVALLALFWRLQKRNVRGWYYYVPLACLIWFSVHESGIHATVAGVAMGLLVNLRNKPGEARSAGDRLLHTIHPYSALFAVPVFAFFSSGISVENFEIQTLLESSLTLGVVCGLVFGKPIGVFLGAYLISKATKAKLASGINWWDIATIGSLAGVGFTVSLLIGELAFKNSEQFSQQSVLSVLIGSLISATVASVFLSIRSRKHTKIDQS